MHRVCGRESERWDEWDWAATTLLAGGRHTGCRSLAWKPARDLHVRAMFGDPPARPGVSGLDCVWNCGVERISSVLWIVWIVCTSGFEPCGLTAEFVVCVRGSRLGRSCQPACMCA